MKFRPCIDLHNGKVKQIVGSTLSDDSPESLKTNFTSEFSSSYYAQMYRRDNLYGGHVIMIGLGNETAAREAFHAFPQGLQAGGALPMFLKKVRSLKSGSRKWSAWWAGIDLCWT
jgi:phosphoribosylformimino-5-aminoimidazole carboxamide ribotide isomerase